MQSKISTEDFLINSAKSMSKLGANRFNKGDNIFWYNPQIRTIAITRDNGKINGYKDAEIDPRSVKLDIEATVIDDNASRYQFIKGIKTCHSLGDKHRIQAYALFNRKHYSGIGFPIPNISGSTLVVLKETWHVRFNGHQFSFTRQINYGITSMKHILLNKLLLNVAIIIKI